MKEHCRSLTRRGFVKGVGAASVTAMTGPILWCQDKAGTKRPVLGGGEHRYECIHDWLEPPKGIKWGDTHGLCQDADGHIYVAHTVHGSSERGDAVVVYDAKGKFVKSWGEEFRGGAHGLDIRKEGSDEFLYHCDIGRRLVVKTSLGGEVLWEKSFPAEAGVYKDKGGFRPTNVAFAPDGGFYVGDGYGSSYIHQYNAAGDYVRTIGLPGKEKGQLSCPHGLWVDDRSKPARLVVADRSNRRLQYFTLDGEHIGFVHDGIRLPCHFKTRGEWMLIPDLESAVMILNGKNKVVATLGDGHPSKLRGAPREKFIPGKFVHPHDAIFLHNGDILVAEWVPIGRITLLRKIG